MLNSFKTAYFLKSVFNGDFLSARACQMGRPEWGEVLVLDCKAASKLWLPRLRMVIEVEHASSGNMASVLVLPSQQQAPACVRGAVGSLLSSAFSDVLLGLPQLQDTQL